MYIHIFVQVYSCWSSELKHHPKKGISPSLFTLRAPAPPGLLIQDLRASSLSADLRQTFARPSAEHPSRGPPGLQDSNSLGQLQLASSFLILKFNLINGL